MTDEMKETDTDETGRLNRRSILKASGVALGAATFAAGTASATTECVECVPLKKIDRMPRLGDVYTWETPDGTLKVKVTDVDTKDGDEVVRFEFEVIESPLDSGDKAICGADVKGGPYVFERRFACGASPGWLRAPRNPKNGKFYGISHVVFYYCASEETVREGEDTCGSEQRTVEMTRGKSGK